MPHRQTGILRRYIADTRRHLAQLLTIAIDLALLVSWSLPGLPVVARWFFARAGTDRSYRFVFGIAAFLVGGVLAEAGGIDAIVGSSVAGEIMACVPSGS